MIDSELSDLPEEFKSLVPKADHVLQAEPSSECATGTKGRIAVMEAAHINDEMEKLILKGATEEELYNAARKNGFISMKEDAIFKALDHTIPFEEVNTLGGELMVTDEENSDEAVGTSVAIETSSSDKVAPEVVNVDDGKRKEV